MKKVLLGVLLAAAGIAKGQNIKEVDVYPDGVYIKEYKELKKAEKAFRKGIMKKKNYVQEGKVRGFTIKDKEIEILASDSLEFKEFYFDILSVENFIEGKDTAYLYGGKCKGGNNTIYVLDVPLNKEGYRGISILKTAKGKEGYECIQMTYEVEVSKQEIVYIVK
jgi:hypothetical protein